MTRCPVLLVFHGSHDAQYQQAVKQFLPQLGADRLIQAGFLDCAPEPLHQQLAKLIQPPDRAANPEIWVMPLFLLPGVHVMDDIPAEIALAQAQCPTVTIRQLPYLGSLPQLSQSLVNGFNGSGRIVIAHGSRRSGGNQPVIELATALQALPAFWSVEPSLAIQVQDLYDRGHRTIEVLPYFLFEGSLTASIQQQLTAMRQTWPDLAITLLPTLAQQSGLIQLITAVLMAPV